MPFSQKDRVLRVTTPLGDDKFLITRLSGTEAISESFRFELDLLAENATKVEFDKIIGQKCSVELDLPGKKKRFFAGICSKLIEGRRDTEFTRYRLEVVPQFWLLTRQTQCRIFQHKKVPDILKEVLEGFDVDYEIKGKYDERDYCVQYRETDFAFANRLMEEEGIFYYFTHGTAGSRLVLADTPEGHANVPEVSKAKYDDARGGNREDMRITEWEKVQELRSGKVTLWDHCFELPGKTLETKKNTQETVAVGKVTHKLKLAANEKLELYDYPGAYAQRYDGIDSGGGDKAADLEKIFADNDRTAKIRMEQDSAEAVQLRGQGDCRQFTAGHKFTLENHFNGDGDYVLLRVVHDARVSANYRSGEGETLEYSNQFTCLPSALPYRSPFKTPEPEIRGPQTATVVGPPGEIIACDKYGRIKVQFHWDRKGKKDAESSCWVRVSQNWGGAGWGGMFIPHVGQEVIVEFEEGDPDRPLITGRVYNAEAMPPLELPGNKTQSILSDYSGNAIKMQGEPGKESIRMFSPYGNTIFKLGAKNDSHWGLMAFTDFNWTAFAGGNYEWEVKGNSTTQVAGFLFQHVAGFQEETTLGWKTEHTIGLHTEVAAIGKVEMMLGWKKEIDPIGHKKAAAQEKEMIGKIDQKFGEVNTKITANRINIGVVNESVRKMTTTIDKLDAKVDTNNLKVTGTLTEELGKLDQKISGAFEQDAGSIKMTSKAKLTLDGNSVLVKSKGTTKLQFASLKANGGPVTMCDGSLKVT